MQAGDCVMSGAMRTSSGQVRDSTVYLKVIMICANDAFRHCTSTCTSSVEQ